MNKVYLLFGLLSSVAIFAPDARADISLPSEKITFVHTLHTHLFSEVYLSPPSFSERQEIKVAQVCWITDTEDCGGADFVGTDGTTGTPPEILPPGGDGGDDGGDYKKSCAQMGYDKTSCPEGYSPDKFCPLDEKYFAECVQDCPTGCKECAEHYKGVGEECCPGKYMKCECNECKGYDYTENNIPAGYIKGESCESCNGWKYKIIPNSCTGFLDCDGKCATGSKTCLSGDKTMCEKCPPCPNACTLAECPANAVCDKEECSGKYCRTGCANGYEWDNATQSCEKKCENKCSLSSCPANAVCAKEECSGKYCRTGCADGYEWDNASQSCKQSCLTGCTNSYCPSGYTCTQDPCTGKYCRTGCSSTYNWFSEQTKECCSSMYMFDESNCPTTVNYHCDSSTCGYKYSDCREVTRFSVDATSVTDGSTTYALPDTPRNYDWVTNPHPGNTTSKYCPNKWKEILKSGSISNGIIDLIECVNSSVSDNCYNWYKNSPAQINLNQNEFCGNLSLKSSSINGNNKTITFSKVLTSIGAGDIYSSTINNLNIVSNESKSQKYYSDLCSSTTYPHNIVKDSTLTNSTITVNSNSDGFNQAAVENVTFKGNVSLKNVRAISGELTKNSNLKINQSNNEGLSPKIVLSLEENSTFSIKEKLHGMHYHKLDIKGNNITLNYCVVDTSQTVEYMINSLAGQNCYDITINSNVEVGRPSSNTYILNCFATPHVKINKDPSVCDIFD